jgi:prepilin-type N-terminal cleavage/methylation domain-containing protein
MSNKYPKTKSLSQAGFTVVEVIVALAVFSIGILATLSMANFGLQASSSNERTVTGLNLAREGVEAVRNIRDSNWNVKARGIGGSAYTWDCLPGPNQGISEPAPGCSLGSTVWKMTDAGSFNYILFPQMANGLWSVNRNTGTGNGSTQDPAYLICPSSGVIDGIPAPFYTPNGAANPCPGGGSPYYRRVQIARGKDMGNGTFNAKVTVYVSWPQKKGNDIVLEEYLTDWREL